MDLHDENLASEMHSERIEVIQIEPLPGEDAAQPKAGAMTEAPGQLLTREQFREFIGGAFRFGGNVPPMLPPVASRAPLQSLIGAPDLPTANPAFDALYDTALEVPYMRFLLDPSSTWFGRVAVIGAFGAQVAFNVRAELQTTTPAIPVKANEEDIERAA